ncbi:MAG: tripartite tricarboxylate transporter TctB family protein [Methyloligellaceae bacterium]
MKIFGELKLNKKQAVFAITILISLGLVLIGYETFNMSPPLLPGYPGDAFYPRLVIGFTAIWCIVILARGWRSGSQENVKSTPVSDFSFHVGEFIAVTIAVLAYAILLKPLGFEISTFLFLFFLLYPRMQKNVTNNLILSTTLSIVTILVLWAVFGFGLKVQLPVKFLPLYIY